MFGFCGQKHFHLLMIKPWAALTRPPWQVGRSENQILNTDSVLQNIKEYYRLQSFKSNISRCVQLPENAPKDILWQFHKN